MCIARLIALAGLLLALGACDVLTQVLPADRVECDGTGPALCDAVARLAVAQMNLTATGPITQVTLTGGDCETLASSTFQGGLRTADRCWAVEVTGERSHGGGYVGLQPDGTLEPFWP